MLIRFVCAMLLLAADLCRSSAGDLTGVVFKDVDGKPYHPFEPAGKAASVLLFYWHDCPVCNSYAPEINRICTSYSNFNFYIVQVDPDLTALQARQHAKEYGFQAPVLLDPSRLLVKRAKATVTPEVVIFGKGEQVLYHGRIDDLYAALGKRRAAAKQHDLRDALDAIAAGKPVKQKETKAVGCLIQSQPE